MIFTVQQVARGQTMWTTISLSFNSESVNYTNAKKKYFQKNRKPYLVSCCLAQLARSAPVLATDSAVRVKSTAITSSQPRKYVLNTCEYWISLWKTLFRNTDIRRTPILIDMAKVVKKNMNFLLVTAENSCIFFLSCRN